MSFFTESLVFLLIGFCCVPPSAAQEKTDAKIYRQEKFKQELMQLQRAVNDAETKQDFAALDRLLTEDYIFTESSGRISNRKQLYEDLKKAEPSAEQTIDFEDVKLFLYGDSAVMSYLLVVSALDKESKENSYRFRGTAVWVKKHKRWRMVAVHVARVRT